MIVTLPQVTIAESPETIRNSAESPQTLISAGAPGSGSNTWITIGSSAEIPNVPAPSDMVKAPMNNPSGLSSSIIDTSWSPRSIIVPSVSPSKFQRLPLQRRGRWIHKHSILTPVVYQESSLKPWDHLS